MRPVLVFFLCFSILCVNFVEPLRQNSKTRIEQRERQQLIIEDGDIQLSAYTPQNVFHRSTRIYPSNPQEPRPGNLEDFAFDLGSKRGKDWSGHYTALKEEDAINAMSDDSDGGVERAFYLHQIKPTNNIPVLKINKNAYAASIADEVKATTLKNYFIAHRGLGDINKQNFYKQNPTQQQIAAFQTMSKNIYEAFSGSDDHKLMPTLNGLGLAVECPLNDEGAREAIFHFNTFRRLKYEGVPRLVVQLRRDETYTVYESIADMENKEAGNSGRLENIKKLINSKYKGPRIVAVYANSNARHSGQSEASSSGDIDNDEDSNNFQIVRNRRRKNGNSKGTKN